MKRDDIKATEVAERYKNGESISALAKSYNTSTCIIFNRLKETNTPRRPSGGSWQKPDPLKYKHKTCIICQSEFRWFPSDPNRKYCSRECQYKAMRSNVSFSCKWREIIEKKCPVCGAEFKTRTTKRFCSKKCADVRGGRVDKTCPICNKICSVVKSEEKRRVYCSRECFGKYRSKTILGSKSPSWQGGKTHPKCIMCGKQISWNCKLCHPCKGLLRRGKNHPNWKGGYSDVRKVWMTRTEYKEWRTSVYKRDSYTCQLCGKNHCYLNAHHIFPIASEEDRIHDVGNGITLCKECHLKTYHKEYKYAFWFFAILGARGFAA